MAVYFYSSEDSILLPYEKTTRKEFVYGPDNRTYRYEGSSFKRLSVNEKIKRAWDLFLFSISMVATLGLPLCKSSIRRYALQSYYEYRTGKVELIKIYVLKEEEDHSDEVISASNAFLAEGQGQKLYDAAFAGFPKQEFYRLPLAYIKNSSHPQNIEQLEILEKGFCHSMNRVLGHYLRTHIGIRMNANELIKMHDICVDQVFDSAVGKFFQKGITAKTRYCLDYKQVTKDAITECEEEHLIQWHFNPHTIRKSTLRYAIKHHKLLCLNPNFIRNVRGDKTVAIKRKIDQFFEAYYCEINLANKEEVVAKRKMMKFAAIAKLCRSLIILHPFQANHRTIACVLLNQLLIENGFSPAILNNSRVFSGYHSIRELVSDIRRGMKNFKECKAWFASGKVD